VLLPPARISGLYADTWSKGQTVTWTQSECSGGTLTVQLESDASLFRTAQTVVAREGGSLLGSAEIAPTAQATLRLPLRPLAGSRCAVVFHVAQTAIPARVEPRSTDTRLLGAHFLEFTYTP
jgi:hypothetical protein